jgi:hypothetical protein
MGTQYAEQFLPGRGRAEQWQCLSPGAGLYTPPHMFTSTNEKPVLVGAPINFLGFNNIRRQFHGAYRNRIKKLSRGVERAHKNITYAIN